ncbi:vacuolar protein sorting-associated protein 37B [Condylostylus longicornis]|uniref:vacuolar protein sorting-associated protein 37B n=1 Tax=Condylostylus longicornis TaxID=2530218 RepID=UPI00244DFB91|nr:vacuolar protein sorting-associated protein 37B [Condylostylus longicornis]
MYQQYMNQLQISLTNLSSDELKDLLNDDDKLEERVIEALKSLEEQKSSLLEENRTFAEGNLLKEPEIIELKGKLSELSQEGKELCSSVQEKLTEFKNKSVTINQDTALALLQTAAAECEEESEKLVKDFLDNELNLESFLDQFLNLRKIMHLRKVKSEKMSEIIQKGQNRGSAYIPPSTGFFNNLSTSGGLPYPTGGIPNIPYPIGPMAMPMPMPMPPRHPY